VELCVAVFLISARFALAESGHDVSLVPGCEGSLVGSAFPSIGAELGSSPSRIRTNLFWLVDQGKNSVNLRVLEPHP
jgi:hypothetical protein